jgi:GntR family transcriptional regulator
MTHTSKLTAHKHLLDKTSPVPLYYQLFLRLQADIQAGIVRPGEMLGTEKDIQQSFGVSRATVRKALDELARGGHLMRITGRGTFVAEPQTVVHTPHLLSFTEEMHRRGMVPDARVLAFERVNPPPEAMAALGCRPGDRIIHLRRLRTGDSTPIVLVDHYLAPPVRLAQADLGQSLYATLEGKLGIRLQEAFHTVRAGTATRDEAELLAMRDGDAVLRFERTTLSADGRPIVFEQGSARPDLYEYSVHLFRR